MCYKYDLPLNSFDGYACCVLVISSFYIFVQEARFLVALVVINDRTLVCTGSSDAMPC